MEIKKIGFEVDSWKQDIECQNCQTELSITNKDVRTPKRSSKKYHIYCPACKSKIDLTLWINNGPVLLSQFVDKNNSEDYDD